MEIELLMLYYIAVEEAVGTDSNLEPVTGLTKVVIVEYEKGY